MDNWFQIHSFIVSYLHGFQYALSTEGDPRLREQYRNYVTYESCRLAEVSQLTGEKRLTELNRQALKIQKELDKFRRLSDERRREREQVEGDRMQLLYSRAHGSFNKSCHRPQGVRRKRR